VTGEGEEDLVRAMMFGGEEKGKRAREDGNETHLRSGNDTTALPDYASD